MKLPFFRSRKRKAKDEESQRATAQSLPPTPRAARCHYSPGRAFPPNRSSIPSAPAAVLSLGPTVKAWRFHVSETYAWQGQARISTLRAAASVSSPPIRTRGYSPPTSYAHASSSGRTLLDLGVQRNRIAPLAIGQLADSNLHEPA
jgi:hypothetical protein